MNKINRKRAFHIGLRFLLILIPTTWVTLIIYSIATGNDELLYKLLLPITIALMLVMASPAIFLTIIIAIIIVASFSFLIWYALSAIKPFCHWLFACNDNGTRVEK